MEIDLVVKEDDLRPGDKLVVTFEKKVRGKK